MHLTKSHLKKIIQEEIKNILKEGVAPLGARIVTYKNGKKIAEGDCMSKEEADKYIALCRDDRDPPRWECKLEDCAWQL